jgi:hypothetical protein
VASEVPCRMSVARSISTLSISLTAADIVSPRFAHGKDYLH